jgi:hypothetical protein
MADETEGQNEVGEEGGVADYDANDGNDIGDIAGTTPPLPPPAPPIIEEGGNSVIEDYPNEDEPLPDFHVKLIINDEPDGVPVTDIVTAAITDELGNVITTTPTWKDAIDDYTATITQVIQDEVTGNGTTVGGKGWLGKSSIEEQRERKRKFQVCVSRCASMKQQR